MSDPTGISDELAREIHAISLAALQGTAGDDELARLDSLVCENAGARRYLGHSMQTCNHLRLWAAAHAKAASACSLPTKAAAERRGLALGLLGRITRIPAGMSLSTALTWMVMALCASGVVLTFAFVALIVHGVNVHIDQARADKPQSSQLGDRPEDPPAARDESDSESRFPPEATADAPPRREGAPQAATVARLIHAYDCHWAIGSHSPRMGDDLQPGRKLELLSGLAEIMFQSGVRAVLQGPATMEVGSKMGAFLRRGRLTVTVVDPDAHGFEIDAPGMKYTDLGTEFGVFVAKGGAQEMHVFRGAVRAEKVKPEISNSKSGISNPSSLVPQPSTLVLTAHQAIRVAAPTMAGKPFETMAADEKQFVRAENLAAVAAEQTFDFRRWKKFSDEMCKRTDLVAYYDFQPDGADRTILRNRAASGARFDGRIAGGAEWCDGRTQGKKALRFERIDSGVRIDIPVKCPRISMVAWVKFDRLDDGHAQSILLSNSSMRRPGCVHWQRYVKRGVGFGIAVSPHEEICGDDRPIAEVAPGEWTMCAMTYDMTARGGGVFLNGDETTVRRSDFLRVTAEIGAATIGGSRLEGASGEGMRPLRGEIDELMIFNAALGPDDIREIYNESRPSDRNR